jgi:hypothetical protein
LNEGWNAGCWSKRKAPDEAGDKDVKLKVSISFRLSLDFVFNLEFLMVEHGILESASVWCRSKREE